MKKIFADVDFSTTPTSQLVNSIGKYLYAHIHDAVRYSKSSNTYELLISTIQQADNEDSEPQQLLLSLSLTTYQNKLRVNVIAHTPAEQTLGYALFRVDNFSSLEDARETILARVNKILKSAYEKTITLI